MGSGLVIVLFEAEVFNSKVIIIVMTNQCKKENNHL